MICHELSSSGPAPYLPPPRVPRLADANRPSFVDPSFSGVGAGKWPRLPYQALFACPLVGETWPLTMYYAKSRLK